MSKLPVVTGQRLIKALHKIGFEVIRSRYGYSFASRNSGEKKGWARLAKNLKAEIDEDLMKPTEGQYRCP